MARHRQLEVRRYRNVPIVLFDDGGRGWLIRVHLPDEPNPRLLRNAAPDSLPALIAEAEALIDRLLGSPASPRQR